MKRLAIFLSVIFIGLVFFCVPLMTVNASTHHMSSGEMQFDCDGGDNLHYFCCSENNARKDVVASTGKTKIKSSQLPDAIKSMEWSVNPGLFNLYSYSKGPHFIRGHTHFLTGSTIKRE